MEIESWGEVGEVDNVLIRYNRQWVHCDANRQASKRQSTFIEGGCASREGETKRQGAAGDVAWLRLGFDNLDRLEAVSGRAYEGVFGAPPSWMTVAAGPDDHHIPYL